MKRKGIVTARREGVSGRDGGGVDRVDGCGCSLGGSGGSGGDDLGDLAETLDITILGELACRDRDIPSILGGTGNDGVVGVDMVLFTVIILARRPSPLGRLISGDGGDGERLSEFQS